MHKPRINTNQPNSPMNQNTEAEMEELIVELNQFKRTHPPEPLIIKANSVQRKLEALTGSRAVELEDAFDVDEYTINFPDESE